MIRFAFAGLTSALATGLFFPYALVFYSRLSTQPIEVVGTILTVSALAVLPLMIPVGRLLNRFSASSILAGAALIRASCFLFFTLTPGFVSLVICAALLAVCGRTDQAASPVLAVRLAPSAELTRWLALSRVVFNAGIGLGAVVASLVLAGAAVGATDRQYVLLSLLVTIGFTLAALSYCALLKSPHSHRDRSMRSLEASVRQVRPWRDRRFMRVSAANSMLWMAGFALEIALPVYIIVVLGLPTWVVAGLFVVNTAMLTALQLPFSRLVDKASPGATLALGGLTFCFLYAALAMAAGLDRQAQIAVLFLGMLVYSVGELAVSQASLTMLNTLPPTDQLGSFASFNQIVVGVMTAFSPLLAGQLVDSRPSLLWLLLGALSAVAALIVPKRRSDMLPEMRVTESP